FNLTATSDTYTLSLHDALPIYYVGKYAFANTHLYKLDFNKNADETAFSNTLLNGQSFKPLELNFITDSIKKEVYINDRKFIIEIDRKSTRLNSSHVKISYAVFC